MKYLVLLFLISCGQNENIYIPNSQVDDECKFQTMNWCGYTLWNCKSRRLYSCEKVILTVQK